MAHLEQTIAWYHHVLTMEQSGAAGDVLLRDRTRRAALEALRLAFDFARAEAALLAQTSGAAAASPAGEAQTLEQRQARTAARVDALKGRLAAVDEKISRAPARLRVQLEAQRKVLAAELNLARQIQATVQSMASFMGSQQSGNRRAGDLGGEIGELERAVPEARRTSQGPAAPAPVPQNVPAAASQMFHPESAGVFGLVGGLLSLTRKRGQMSDLVRETDGMAGRIDQLRIPLVAELRGAIGRSETLANGSDSADAPQLAAWQKEIESLAARIKVLSSVLVPLREQGIVVGTVRGDLLEARSEIDEQTGTAGRYLFFRLLSLAVAILAVLFLSELWRRVTFRYIRDARRRRQFLVLRRVLVTFAVALVVIFGFVTEFGSLATYAGLLTAGIAVALQNVLLSVVAYFFLIGRNGIRVGDRVTISGVTGNVIDIGLVRLYLMELAGTGGDLHETGRVVVFSNSVLFQPAAMFKQMPGADYVWHTVKLTLAPDADFQLAQTRLTEAVNSVYNQYRADIERQHAAFERSVDIQIAPPRPECRLRFTDAGLEFSVHYPVQRREASQTDRCVMQALYDEIGREPRLMLASAGSPKLQETA